MMEVGLCDFAGLYKLLIVLTLSFICYGEHLLQTVSDVVEGGNYTFYQIRSNGRLRLQLISLSGDADVYISDQNSHPTYDHYDLKSCTCGEDVIELPSSLRRPIGVGVYGHPFHPESRYSLSVYWVADHDDMDYANIDAMFNSDEGLSSEQQLPNIPKDTSTKTRHEEEEESTVWTILVTILKILFDILL